MGHHRQLEPGHALLAGPGLERLEQPAADPLAAHMRPQADTDVDDDLLHVRLPHVSHLTPPPGASPRAPWRLSRTRSS
ncbi:hypothetical protein SDC9_173277 [bioreactor metagenome]|uniref:Uncharacterized protein n=1 Tax=bioreactor metagenome TaxID=1076179 RepID=A0A645GJ67_9ZZZZ